MLEGIDVSHHQSTTPGLAGLDFLFARATYGTFADDRFASHIGHARAAGLVVGAYHFGRHGDVAGQLAAFLEAAGLVDLYVLDLEADGANPPMSIDEARAFVAGLQAAGHPAGLYHSTAGYPELGQDWRWVADYRLLAEPPIAWDIWQYRGSPLDLDRFRGTRAELVALGREVPMQAPIDDETPKIITALKGAKLYELDNRTVIRTLTADLAERPSPYGVSGRRAIFANNAAGARQLVLITAATAVGIPDAVRRERKRVIAAGVAVLQGLDTA